MADESNERGQNQDIHVGIGTPMAQVRNLVAQGDPDRVERLERERNQLAESRKLYSDESGSPTLRRSFAVYLDLLGTKERMPLLDDRMLRKQLDQADSLTWFLHDETVEYDSQRLMRFTDNLIVGTPVHEDAPGGQGLGVLLTNIDDYQLAMAMEGAFIRGGVTVGSLYMDANTVTGEALVEAVGLEEQVAVFPRVVLSEQCVSLAMADCEAYAPGFSYLNPWNTQLIVDADGEVFLSYLGEVFDYDDDQRAKRGALLSHADAIRAKLLSFTESGRVRSKYKWSADYHNYFCMTHFEELPDLLIADELTKRERIHTRQFRPFSI